MIAVDALRGMNVMFATPVYIDMRGRLYPKPALGIEVIFHKANVVVK